MAAVFAGRMADEAGRYARAVSLEPQLAGLLPEVLLGLGPQEFAALAAAGAGARGRCRWSRSTTCTRRRSACGSRPRSWSPPCGGRGRCTFRALTADCEGTLVVVARFLALLELYREGAVAFDQVDPLGELHVRWTGTDEGEVEVADEFDDDADDPRPRTTRRSETPSHARCRQPTSPRRPTTPRSTAGDASDD